VKQNTLESEWLTPKFVMRDGQKRVSSTVTLTHCHFLAHIISNNILNIIGWNKIPEH
jgi:hypothetical protein